LAQATTPTAPIPFEPCASKAMWASKLVLLACICMGAHAEEHQGSPVVPPAAPSRVLQNSDTEATCKKLVILPDQGTACPKCNKPGNWVHERCFPQCKKKCWGHPDSTTTDITSFQNSNTRRLIAAFARRLRSLFTKEVPDEGNGVQVHV